MEEWQNGDMMENRVTQSEPTEERSEEIGAVWLSEWEAMLYFYVEVLKQISVLSSF